MRNSIATHYRQLKSECSGWAGPRAVEVPLLTLLDSPYLKSLGSFGLTMSTVGPLGESDWKRSANGGWAKLATQ